MKAEEGIEQAWERHAKMHRALREGLEAMGLSLVVEKKYRLPQLNTVAIPEGVDESKVRATLLSRYNLEIGTGLGDLAGKVWRVGLMGQSSKEEHVTLFLSAMEDALLQQDAAIKTGVALPAARAVIQ